MRVNDSEMRMRLNNEDWSIGLLPEISVRTPEMGRKEEKNSDRDGVEMTHLNDELEYNCDSVTNFHDCVHNSPLQNVRTDEYMLTKINGELKANYRSTLDFFVTYFALNRCLLIVRSTLDQKDLR